VTSTRRRCLAPLGASLLFLGSGCNGLASVHVIPMGSKRISATAPLIQRVAPGECYYWVDGNGALCVAMRQHRGQGLGKLFEYDAAMSLVFGGPPSGPARTYGVSTRTFRSRTRHGLTHTRAASTSGVAGVWDYGKPRLRGRFRLVAKEQSYWAPIGWGADRFTLIVGEFVAVYDRAKGERLLEITEEGELARPKRDASPNPMLDFCPFSGLFGRIRGLKVEGWGCAPGPGIL